MAGHLESLLTAVLNILCCIFFSISKNTVIDLTDSPVKAKTVVKASPVVIEDPLVMKQLHADYKFLDGDPGPGMLCTEQPLKVKKEDLRAEGNPPYYRYEFFFCQFSNIHIDMHL